MLLNPDFTVGNTITVGIAIYKQNWRQYLKLSAIAHLWLLIPVYGWARYFAIAAWMSRLSFSKLAQDFDRLKRHQYFTFDSLIKLFIISISSIFIPLIVGNIFMIPLAVILPIIFKLLLQLPAFLIFLESDNMFLLGYIALFFCYFIWIGIYTRLFVTDLTYGNYLANSGIYSYPINRSYLLTKNSFSKIYKIIWLSFLVSLPIYLLVFLCIFAVTLLLYAVAPDKSYLLVLFLPTVLFLSHGLIMPYWQSIKAVVFYQLSRRSKNY